MNGKMFPSGHFTPFLYFIFASHRKVFCSYAKYAIPFIPRSCIVLLSSSSLGMGKKVKVQLICTAELSCNTKLPPPPVYM